MPYKHIRKEVLQPYSFLLSALHGGQWSNSHSVCFIPGRKTWYPLNTRMGGPKAGFECFGAEKSIALVGVRTSDHHVRSLVTVSPTCSYIEVKKQSATQYAHWKDACT